MCARECARAPEHTSVGMGPHHPTGRRMGLRECNVVTAHAAVVGPLAVLKGSSSLASLMPLTAAFGISCWQIKSWPDLVPAGPQILLVGALRAGTAGDTASIVDGSKNWARQCRGHRRNF